MHLTFPVVTQLTLCSPVFGTSGTSACNRQIKLLAQTQLMLHAELNPIVLHLLTQWHCL